MGQTAFVFPGQGVQTIGMGKDFYDNFQAAKDVFIMASDAAGMDIAKLCFEENEMINVTEYTQMAILTTELAILEVVKQKIKPDVSAGLSLGEYAALVTAGAVSVEKVIPLIRKRGKLMQEAVPEGKGCMAVVIGLQSDLIERECGLENGNVQIANYNSPLQSVLSGETEAVHRVMKKLKEQGAKLVSELSISVPSHCQLMVEAGDKLGAELIKMKFGSLQIPYIPNCTAQYCTDEKKIVGFLIRQLSAPVYWYQSIQEMIQNGVDTIIEIGPGNTLKKLNKKIDSNIKTYSCSNIQEYDALCEIQF